MVAGFRKATWESPLLAGVSFPWVKAGVGVGGKKAPSSSSWQKGRGKSEVGRSWFPRRLHPVGYSPSLSGTGSPDLGVFWQASCHGDVNVQHHPLNPPPQRIRHIFPSSLALSICCCRGDGTAVCRALEVSLENRGLAALNFSASTSVAFLLSSQENGHQGALQRAGGWGVSVWPSQWPPLASAGKWWPGHRAIQSLSFWPSSGSLGTMWGV